MLRATLYGVGFGLESVSETEAMEVVGTGVLEVVVVDRWNELLATAAIAGISAMRGRDRGSDRGARLTERDKRKGGGGREGGGGRGCDGVISTVWPTSKGCLLYAPCIPPAKSVAVKVPNNTCFA